MHPELPAHEHQELCVGQEGSLREKPSPTFKHDSSSVRLHALLMLLYMLCVARLQRIRQGNGVQHTYLVHLHVQESTFMGLCVCFYESVSKRKKERRLKGFV